MLQHSAVLPQTLGLLKSLMEESFLADFYLVGGTALALQLGHRISEDIDLFTEKSFSPQKILSSIEKSYNINKFSIEENTLRAEINKKRGKGIYVKTDFMSFHYKRLREIQNVDGIRMLHIDDIIPMKLSAIVNRGSKKDFYDIYFLLDKYNIDEMMELFIKKFEASNTFHVYKSLTYFNDAENDADPRILSKVTWEQVKKKLISVVNI